MDYKIKKVFGIKQVSKRDGTGSFPVSTVLSETDEMFDMFGKPEVGDTVSGELEDTQYGKRLKKPTQGNTGGGGGYRGSSPEDRKSIERQVAFKGAIEITSAAIRVGTIKKYSTKIVLNIANEFVKWISEGKEPPKLDKPDDEEQNEDEPRAALVDEPDVKEPEVKQFPGGLKPRDEDDIDVDSIPF